MKWKGKYQDLLSQRQEGKEDDLSTSGGRSARTDQGIQQRLSDVPSDAGQALFAGLCVEGIRL